MRILGFDINWGKKKVLDVPKTVETQPLAKVTEEKVQLPVAGGRETQPEGVNSLAQLIRESESIEPDFNIKLLNVLEYLAKYNADLSYAVNNIVQLGNTSYSIKFDETVNEATQQEIKKYIETKKKKWYAHSGGLNSLINDLLAQVAITGAVSAENVPSNDLSGIKKVVLVNPSTIKFTYNAETDEYTPNQATSSALGTVNGLKPLNTVTYKYIAIQRLSEKPYAIPPFLSALESIAIEKDMMSNFRHIVKQLGVFGFLEVLMTAPQQRRSTGVNGELPETDAQYQERCRAFLEAQKPEVQKGLASGFVMGFKDTHEFDMKGNLSNPQGAIELFKMNTEIKMSGLKQDPLMLGRNFSTTEAIGRVILTKLSAQIANYQKLTASFLEELILIDVNLAGWSINKVDIEFEKPMLADQMKDEEAFGQRIANAQQLYNDGIMTQAEKAQYLGFDEPAESEPIRNMDGTMPIADTTPTTTSNSLPTSQDIEELEIELGILSPEFRYHSDCDCGGCKSKKLSYGLDWNDPKTQEFFDNYVKDSNVVYDKALKKQLKKITNALEKLGNGATEQQITDVVIYNLYKDWKTVFSEPQKKIISKWVSISYKTFRLNKDVVAGIKDIPETTFGLTDLRTIEYFKASDDLYMGRFITDADTRKKMTEYIKNKYVAGNMPVGENKAGMADFRTEFGNLLQGEDWKISRIIATTTNKLRNYASLATMTEAEVDKFKVLGTNDRLQCGWCKELNGKSFIVSTAQERVDKFVKSDPQYVALESEFVNKTYRGDEGLAAMKRLSTAEIQAAGIDLPAYHPNCRCTIVADI